MLLLMRKNSEKSRQRRSLEPVPLCLVNRRDFIKTTSLAAGALALGVPTLLRGQNLNSKLNIACIGAMGGKGRSDTDLCACAGENIVALCDVDSGSEGLRDADAKISEREVLQRFPPDAGSNGQPDRCGDGFDAGSFARDCGLGGDEDAQGRLLPETIDADDL
jgi:hypothetical protein